MRFLIFAFVALATLAAGCSYDPCSSPETRTAWIGAGGPVGLVAALALSCPHPESPQQPIAAVASSGLSAQQQPDLGAGPDMGAAPPDLAPIVCGPGTVLDGQFCSPDTDGDGVPDRIDQCKALAAGQSPDPARRGCPAPRVYSVTLPAAAFAATAGAVTIHDGTASSLPSFDWPNLRHSPATLTSIVFFQNAAPNVTNAVSFELKGVADFTAPLTTLDSCASLAKDNRGQDAVTRAPNDIACIARRLALCPVDIVTDASRLFGESECADITARGSGYVSKALAPVTLTASVSSADWRSSEPKPVAGIEVQIVLSGTVRLSDWQVVAHITETQR